MRCLFRSGLPVLARRGRMSAGSPCDRRRGHMLRLADSPPRQSLFWFHGDLGGWRRLGPAVSPDLHSSGPRARPLGQSQADARGPGGRTGTRPHGVCPAAPASGQGRVRCCPPPPLPALPGTVCWFQRNPESPPHGATRKSGFTERQDSAARIPALRGVYVVR